MAHAYEVLDFLGFNYRIVRPFIHFSFWSLFIFSCMWFVYNWFIDNWFVFIWFINSWFFGTIIFVRRSCTISFCLRDFQAHLCPVYGDSLYFNSNGEPLQSLILMGGADTLSNKPKQASPSYSSMNGKPDWS